MNNFIYLDISELFFSSLQLDPWQGAWRELRSKFWTSTDFKWESLVGMSRMKIIC